jgi:hypothetical protein
MSPDPISAITSISTHRAAAESPQQPSGAVDLHSLTAMPPAPNAHPGGAAIALPDPAQAPSAMNLQSLAHQFSQGLQHGFYAQDIHRLMDKLAQSKQPNSHVTSGDVTAELLSVQAKIGIADAFSKISAKLSEGLQTMVVKQG